MGENPKQSKAISPGENSFIPGRGRIKYIFFHFHVLTLFVGGCFVHTVLLHFVRAVFAMTYTCRQHLKPCPFLPQLN